MTMNRRQLLVLLVITVAALALTPAAKAEALFIPIVDGKAIALPPPPPVDEVRWRRRPPIPPSSTLPFRVTGSKVDVKVEENIATTSMEQTFLNLTQRDLEVRVMIPLPAGASINSS